MYTSIMQDPMRFYGHYVVPRQGPSGIYVNAHPAGELTMPTISPTMWAAMGVVLGVGVGYGIAMLRSKR